VRPDGFVAPWFLNDHDLHTADFGGRLDSFHIDSGILPLTTFDFFLGHA
jgi:hypothetical protein